MGSESMRRKLRAHHDRETEISSQAAGVGYEMQGEGEGGGGDVRLS